MLLSEENGATHPSVNVNGSALADDPLWYKDAIIYQTHVRSFYDSDGNGIGDFRGLTSKLPYLEELGINTIWLLPFYPSPLKDDGYDIADYTDVHSNYGTIQDFTRFLREAHRRGIRVITELVINHTSDQHPWFRRARKARPGSKDRDFYVWSDTPEKYLGTRIIFKDFEPSNWSADPVAKAYYWHRFYSHQPDLNFDNPEVRKAIFYALDFWMRRGVDGLRLDAVPYLFEREGTSCENLPETHAFLKELRQYLDSRYRNRMVLGEANQWPDDAAAYFGSGDECHMNFHFPLMPRLFMSIRMENRYPIVDIMQQTPPIPENCQWATFLRNHDELTLEMVTDRERDYMYQAYARDREMRINLGIRRRLAPLLNSNRRAIELMNGLLFSMPGSPIIYYGDEIGMGDNVYLGDRNGVRTPMQWSSDRNAGFSRANPQRLYLPVIIDPQFHYESVNVEAQENNPQSLLWWMRRLIGLRKRFLAFGRGTLEFLPSSNIKVLSFLREYGSERILVVANLSRFVQQVELDLSRFVGMAPVEVFGQTRFRPVGPDPYYLTLSPYAFYWFSLEPVKTEVVSSPLRPSRLELSVNGSWENAFEGRPRAMLERSLPDYLNRFAWLTAAARKVERAKIVDVIRITHRKQAVSLLLVQVEYAEGIADTLALPLAYAPAKAAAAIEERSPNAIVAHVKIGGKEEGVLYDALRDEQTVAMLLSAIRRERRFSGSELELVATAREATPKTLALPEDNSQATILRAEERRVSAAFDHRLILKTFRRLESPINPDLEVGRFLTDRGFPHVPAVVGSLEIRRLDHEPMTMSILHQYVPHEGTAWDHMIDSLNSYFERAVAKGSETPTSAIPCDDLFSCLVQEPPALARELIGFDLNQASLLGRRTAELHLALASDHEDPAFAPEPFTTFYQRSQFQSLHNLRAYVFQNLRARLPELPEDVRDDARAVLDAEPQIRERFRAMRDRKFRALRIRCHGNYYLGQVLYTGKDFVITDFEGDPARSLSERRGKHSAMRDVARMIRSFYRVAYAATLAEAEGALPAGMAALVPWQRFWQTWTPVHFLKGYLETTGKAPFVPHDEEELRVLLEISLLEKSLLELAHEMDHRLNWVRLPLQAILDLLRPAERTVRT